MSLEARSREDLDGTIRNEYHCLLLAIVQFVSAPVGDWWLKVDKLASQILEESKLRAWVIEQNVLKGLAPPSSELGIVSDDLCIVANGPDVLNNTPRSDKGLNMNRTWIRRYRLRWGMTLGKVPSSDTMSPDDLRDKVGFSLGNQSDG